MRPEQATILDQIAEILYGMLDDWDPEMDGPINGQSKLSQDLCLTSIDVMHLLASIDMRYQKKLPYERLILEDGKYRTELSVEDLANFVWENFDSAEPSPQSM